MPNVSAIEYTEGQNLIVNRIYADLLRCMQLDSSDSLWHYADKYPDGCLVKKIRERDVIRLKLPDIRGYVFIKRHHAGYTGMKQGMIFPGRIPSEGRKEFFHICQFRKHGLATVTPVAAGECSNGSSFIVTEDFSPFATLENLLAHDTGFRERMKNPDEKKTLLAEIARYARKMHDSGLNHCDFNADHVLIHYDGNSDKPAVAVYDLQRIRKKKYFRFRWLIKSIAELAFSLPDEFFNENDRKSLLLFYNGKEKYGLPEKIQFLWINKKIEIIRKHTEKIMDRHRKEGDLI
ncbi:MAG: lipopolysaccharide kinase InaA family protein [Desulfococcaceae bacterium]